MQNELVDIDWYMELIDNTLIIKSNLDRQVRDAEDYLIEKYKEMVIQKKASELSRGEITYQDFKSIEDKISKISTFDVEPLTKEEIENNLKDSVLIQFNKFYRLGQMLKLSQGDLLVIGSMTGTGKTGFMLNLMSDLMQDYQCIYFNMEMSKSSLYKRLIAINSNVEINDLSNEENEEIANRVYIAKQNIINSRCIVQHQINYVEDIKTIVKQVKDKRHTILFLDHLGLTRVKSASKNSLYEQMTEIMKELRQICLECDCTIIGASQLNRTAYVSEELSLNMLKDSGELENSARKIILLYRDRNSKKEDLEPTMNVDICKNDSGPLGVLQMQYIKPKQIFKEIYGS